MKRIDLTQGPIGKNLISLALPIIATSFVQMAYNFIDMIWIGRIGSRAVASVGTAGFYVWFSFAFILIAKIGAEIKVSQSVGRGDIKDAKHYIKSSIQIIVILAIVYSMFAIIFSRKLIEFFNIDDEQVLRDAVDYLKIVAIGFVCFFINPVFSAIFTGYGNSKLPFKINFIGLLTNIILDPIFIFGIGIVPKMGVRGAAIATIISQMVATTIFIYYAEKSKELFDNLNFKKIEINYIKTIFKLGLPASLQSGLFTIIAMFIARLISTWGPYAIAAQKIGAQVEAISYMTAGGFQSALGAFVGQNFGAKKVDRIKNGYKVAIVMVTVVGFVATILFFIFPREIYSVFVKEEQTILFGIDYFKIIAISQIFMCLEITTAGAFNGLGYTIPASLVGITFNFIRIPLAYMLSSTVLGLNGIWWSISLSSILKGMVLVIWFMFYLKMKDKKGWN